MFIILLIPLLDIVLPFCGKKTARGSRSATPPPPSAWLVSRICTYRGKSRKEGGGWRRGVSLGPPLRKRGSKGPACQRAVGTVLRPPRVLRTDVSQRGPRTVFLAIK
eukprot:4334914-Pyramimonas_sp.AAC.1